MKITAILLIGLLLNCHAMAEIYEIVDEQGNKTYTNTPPQNTGISGAVQVTPKDTNIWEGEENQEQLNEEYYQELTKEQAAQDANQAEKRKVLQDALRKLKEAEQAYKEASTLKEGDYFRNKNGGLRERPEFKQRIEAARIRLEQAQQYYDSVK